MYFRQDSHRYSRSRTLSALHSLHSSRSRSKSATLSKTAAKLPVTATAAATADVKIRAKMIAATRVTTTAKTIAAIRAMTAAIIQTIHAASAHRRARLTDLIVLTGRSRDNKKLQTKTSGKLPLVFYNILRYFSLSSVRYRCSDFGFVSYDKLSRSQLCHRHFHRRT